MNYARMCKRVSFPFARGLMPSAAQGMHGYGSDFSYKLRNGRSTPQFGKVSDRSRGLRSETSPNQRFHKVAMHGSRPL